MRCGLDYSEGEARIANLSHLGLAWSKSRWFCKRATKAANVQSDLGIRCPYTAYGSFSYASHHIMTETGHAKQDTGARVHSESPVGWMIHSPANTRRLNHVDSTLNQRQDVESTLNRFCFNVLCPLGWLVLLTCKPGIGWLSIRLPRERPGGVNSYLLIKTFFRRRLVWRKQEVT